MDGILDKLLEIIKEKASKKQIIVIIGLVCLCVLEAPPLHIVIVTMYAVTAQTVLDYFNPIKEKNNENSSSDVGVPAGA